MHACEVQQRVSRASFVGHPGRRPWSIVIFIVVIANIIVIIAVSNIAIAICIVVLSVTVVIAVVFVTVAIAVVFVTVAIAVVIVTVAIAVVIVTVMTIALLCTQPTRRPQALLFKFGEAIADRYDADVEQLYMDAQVRSQH